MERPKLQLVPLVTLMLIATLQAAEERHPSRRQIVVSIPDWKLAVLEGGRVLKIYSTAVGASSSQSPRLQSQSGRSGSKESGSQDPPKRRNLC